MTSHIINIIICLVGERETKVVNKVCIPCGGTGQFMKEGLLSFNERYVSCKACNGEGTVADETDAGPRESASSEDASATICEMLLDATVSASSAMAATRLPGSF